jgi:NADH:ubiquinone oxidoreductase subunit 6 (subunit J)
MITDVVFWAFAALAIFSGWRVFRADSMVRAAYWLLLSFAAVGIILVLLKAQFLGLILILMMGGEMTIMVVFMVAFMMNPAGLNPMTMVHRNTVAIVAAVVSFLAIAALGLFARFPVAKAPAAVSVTGELGTELLGDSMLVFQTAGVTLLAAMIAAIAISSARGRYGDADEGSVEPEQLLPVTGDPEEDAGDMRSHGRHAGPDVPSMTPGGGS